MPLLLSELNKQQITSNEFGVYVRCQGNYLDCSLCKYGHPDNGNGRPIPVCEKCFVSYIPQNCYYPKD